MTAYAIRAQYRMGDASTETVYGTFRSAVRAHELADKMQALALAVEAKDGEGDYGDLVVDVMYIQPASLDQFANDYGLLGDE